MDSRGGFRDHEIGPDYPSLCSVADDNWFGEPLDFSAARSREEIERIRTVVLGGTRAKPLEHLGEAQSIYALTHEAGYRDSILVTDDRAALDLARRRRLGAWNTTDLFREACSNDDMSPDEAHGLLSSMYDAERGVQVPSKPQDLLL